ncbi:uncharacterized protein [Aegilops tauschii subsp. strangulata]|uniref:uncharacterized protein n=1 Tax=Aegilops tauschii subsp. strangulata TaxID=200361 RepID=UPI003CC8A548
MSKDLFFRICNEVKQHNPVFEQRRNCAGLLGHSIEQKVTAALRMMAYGAPANYIDDNLAMAESTSIFYVKQFAITMVEVFGPQYLRAPNAQDTQRLLEMNKARGFQAVADHETWIWHAYFGMPGSCNDINMLDRSPLFANLANEEAPPVTFEANGRTYNYGYYLADGIYPRWSTFVKPVVKPEDYNFYQLMSIRVNPMRKEERIRRFMKVYSEIRDTDVHDQLQKDLMEEHWKWHGERSA